MSSTSWTQIVTTPFILAGLTTLVNYSVGLPTDYIIKDLGIVLSVSIADSVLFNYLIDPYVINDNTASSFVNILGEPITYSLATHVARMFVQRNYNKLLTYSLLENSVLYMSADYLSTPIQNLL